VRLRGKCRYLTALANERRIVRQPQLLEDPRAVGTDRARAEKHLSGISLICLPDASSHIPGIRDRRAGCAALLCAIGELITSFSAKQGLHTYPTDNLADALVRSSLALPLLMYPAPPALNTFAW